MNKFEEYKREAEWLKNERYKNYLGGGGVAQNKKQKSDFVFESDSQ